MELVEHRHGRIDILDAIRGIAILSMVVYHALYDVNDVFGFRVRIFDYLTLLEPPFAGAFIFLAGVSCRFSHNNVQRGLRVLLVAMIVTVATVLFSLLAAPGEEIWFGILHFMAVAILLYVPLRRPLDKIPPAAAMTLWLLLFAVTFRLPSQYVIGLPGLPGLHIPESVAFFSDAAVRGINSVLQPLFHTALPASAAGVIGLYPLGLPGADFSSADYFPLIPWFFLFLAGTVAGVPIRDHRLPERFYTARVPFFASAGRNTLLIYVLHQPVIYAVLLPLFGLLSR